MTAQVVGKIDVSVLQARLQQDAMRKRLDRYNAKQNDGFKTTIGDLIK